MYIVNLVQVVIIRLPALTLSAESFSLNFVKNRKLSSWVVAQSLYKTTQISSVLSPL